MSDSTNHVAQPPDKVALRHKDTGKVEMYWTVDAREILAADDSQYEPAGAEA